MIVLTRKQKKLIEAATLALGGALCVLPLVLAFPSRAGAFASAIGLLIVVVAAANLGGLRAFEQGSDLALGLVAAVAPWGLDFDSHGAATAVHLVVGLAIVVLGIIRLRDGRRDNALA